ncbi:MAG: YggS family pyridoxal phosphate enzyme, partial [Pseudomonadota bacterium]
QEAQAKWPSLKADFPDAKLHLIGSLQSNKVEDAASLFDVIETLDREKLAKTLAALKKKGLALPELLIQVNTGEEDQKGGIAPREAAGFASYCLQDLSLPVTGLMAIPPAEDAPAPHFALLHKLAGETGLTRLSMGMSGDYEIATQLGATDVRVGSAIFGPRRPKSG